MVLAAGFGTRLGDLGRNTPKCLLEAGGKTLLEHTVERLKIAGVKSLVINLHHLSEVVETYVRSKGMFGIEVEFSRETEILGTGGGIKHAQRFLESEDNFFVHNADVYTTLDLTRMLKAHEESKSLATLAVMERKNSRPLLFSSAGELRGWYSDESNQGNTVGDSAGLVPLAFSGIHVVSSRIFSYFEETAGAFSIVHSYMQAVRRGEAIRAFRMDDARWFDIGTVERLQALQKFLQS